MTPEQKAALERGLGVKLLGWRYHVCKGEMAWFDPSGNLIEGGWHPLDSEQQTAMVREAMLAKGFEFNICGDRELVSVNFSTLDDGGCFGDAPTYREALCIAAGKALGIEVSND